jgi:hypothetical protein
MMTKAGYRMIDLFASWFLHIRSMLHLRGRNCEVAPPD